MKRDNMQNVAADGGAGQTPSRIGPAFSCSVDASLNSERRRCRLILVVLAAALVVFALVSYTLGRYTVRIDELLSFIWTSVSGAPMQVSNEVASVVVNVRFPRITAAILIGAALALAGAGYQGVFKNPMVSPDILGASAGAGFGASIAILLGLSGFAIQITSFLFGLGAVAITYLIGRAVGQRDSTTLVLVLAGMVVGAMLSAFISIVKYLADPFGQLPEITFWLMGGLSTLDSDDVNIMLAPLAIGFAILLALRWRINVLSFGDEEAETLGVNSTRLRAAIIVAATLITSSSVAVAGQIGWVGLVIPHFARMIVGSNYRYLMPASLLCGAIYLLIIDNIARNLLMIEIPLGVLTAIIGAPVFVFLLIKGKRGWS